MDAQELRKAGVLLDYCRNAVVPQIPVVADVLHVLGFGADDEYYRFCVANVSTYVVNVHLVAAGAAHKVLNMEKFNLDTAKVDIAWAILELCPPEACCWFNSVYRDIVRLTGQSAPPDGQSRESLMRGCSCESCRETVESENMPLADPQKDPMWMTTTPMIWSESEKLQLVGGHAVG